VVGFTTGSRVEVPGKKENLRQEMMMMMIIIMPKEFCDIDSTENYVSVESLYVFDVLTIFLTKYVFM
jgi:hypothetical protein